MCIVIGGFKGLEFDPFQYGSTWNIPPVMFSFNVGGSVGTTNFSSGDTRGTSPGSTKTGKSCLHNLLIVVVSDMSFNVEVERTLCAHVVTVNGLPHLQLKHEDYRGMQSYVEGFGPPDQKWAIEFYYLGMDPIIAEYDSRDKWIAVLTSLRPYLK